MDISKIIRGWTNLTLDQLNLLKPEIKELGLKRMEICNTCSVRTDNKCDKTKSINHVKTGELVHGCSCNLSAKCLDPSSSCIAGKW